MLTVCIVNIHPIARFGIASLLKERYEKLAWEGFASLEDFLTRQSGPQPDLLITTLGTEHRRKVVSEMAGVRREFPGLVVVLVTDKCPVEKVVACFRAGVRGHYAISESTQEFFLCIEQVLNGSIYLSPFYVNGLLEILWKRNAHLRRLDKPEPFSLLTPRQYEIARLLAEGFTTSRIATMMGLKMSTVSTQKSKIFSKLQITSVVGLVNML